LTPNSSVSELEDSNNKDLKDKDSQVLQEFENPELSLVHNESTENATVPVWYFDGFADSYDQYFGAREETKLPDKHEHNKESVNKNSQYSNIDQSEDSTILDSSFVPSLNSRPD